jgi:uncharacterized YigZ family protein
MITLAEPFRHDLEVKGSRFIAKAAPVESPDEALGFLARVREPEANHNVWAYKIGPLYRFADDGEPSGTAGRPVLSSIEGQGLDEIMVVVARYFGGVKLGAGGLVRAYSGAAAECLRRAPKRKVVPTVRLRLEAPFELSNAVFYLLEGVQRESETYTEQGLQLVFVIEEAALPAFSDRLRDLSRGRARLERLV